MAKTSDSLLIHVFLMKLKTLPARKARVKDIIHGTITT